MAFPTSPTATEARRQPAAVDVLDRLQTLVNQIEEKAAALESRLTCITQPSVPTPGRPEIDKAPSLPALLNGVHNANEKLALILNHLNSLYSRLEV